ncbi:MAG: hypothetical protein AAF497_15570 [Planctomycetota bacterium]
MDRWVEITFDCLPLRSITRLDIPMDASPKYRAKCERLKAAMEKHGSHNSYYLHNAHCVFHVVNSEKIGAIDFSFEGTVLTDTNDKQTKSAELHVELAGETCDWLNEPIKDWFAQTVVHAVKAEFDRYIQAGDLDQARERIEKIEQASDDAGGFVGMYL